jgi:hypothetical protein
MNKRTARAIRKGILLARYDIKVLALIQALDEATDHDAEVYASIARAPKNKYANKAYEHTMEKESEAIRKLTRQIKGEL